MEKKLSVYKVYTVKALQDLLMFIKCEQRWFIMKSNSSGQECSPVSVLVTAELKQSVGERAPLSLQQVVERVVRVI